RRLSRSRGRRSRRRLRARAPREGGEEPARRRSRARRRGPRPARRTVMRLVDSHGHVDGEGFDEDRAEVLARARAAGVERFVTVGTGEDLRKIRRAVDLAEKEPDVFATVGVHPHDAARIEPSWWAELESWARGPRVVGVGETGLDCYYPPPP